MQDKDRKRIEHIRDQLDNKRAKIVISKILERGSVTTEELEKEGYKHPPRAARDVREAGIPLETFRVKSSDRSRSIAAYRFGKLEDVQKDRLEGRSILSKELRNTLYEATGGKCYICGTSYDVRYLQVDHKVPYEVSGDTEDDINPEDYSVICGSCNRTKSWSCEHCLNWMKSKNPSTCLSCYWASPAHFDHIAMEPYRRVELVWKGEKEVQDFEALRKKAKTSVPEYLKETLEREAAK